MVERGLEPDFPTEALQELAAIQRPPGATDGVRDLADRLWASIDQRVEAVVESTLGHLAEHITRVEVHLSDENAMKGGITNKRCMMEARLETHQPIAVKQEGVSLDQAIDGAVHKLKRLLVHTLSRLIER